jgi:hypothetical protein
VVAATWLSVDLGARPREGLVRATSRAECLCFSRSSLARRISAGGCALRARARGGPRTDLDMRAACARGSGAGCAAPIIALASSADAHGRDGGGAASGEVPDGRGDGSSEAIAASSLLLALSRPARPACDCVGRWEGPSCRGGARSMLLSRSGALGVARLAPAPRGSSARARLGRAWVVFMVGHSLAAGDSRRGRALPAPRVARWAQLARRCCYVRHRVALTTAEREAGARL